RLLQGAQEGRQARLLAMVLGRMGYWDLQAQRPDRRRLGEGRPAPGRPRSRHRPPHTENRPVAARSCAPASGPMTFRMPRFSQPDTRVHDALRRIGPLPVLGGTVARIRMLADDPNGTTSDLVAVIEADEAFAANLLRYANSAANARPIRART